MNKQTEKTCQKFLQKNLNKFNQIQFSFWTGAPIFSQAWSMLLSPHPQIFGEKEVSTDTLHWGFTF